MSLFQRRNFGVALALFSVAAALPTFEDFRQVDRARRAAQQWQSETAARLTQPDLSLVRKAAAKHRADWELQWGAAELLSAWEEKRACFEVALKQSGTNVAVALRFGCALACEEKPEPALQWLAYCQQHDKSNAVPYLAELWVLRKMGDEDRFEPTGAGPLFRDYAEQAARARIRLLEAAGYSKYAARRIGFLPSLYAVRMAQDLRKGSHAAYVEQFLLDTAKAMQTAATYLVTELAGESLETAMLDRQKDSPLKETRLEELERRRASLGELVREMDQRVELATEARMVQYFDELLLLGEIEAMKRLGRDVGKPR